MKLFSYCKDGGQDSNVSGFFLIEIKCLFSIALLIFENGSRSAYHSHAFNCFSWLLKGTLKEQMLNGEEKIYTPSLYGFGTYRNTFHKVTSIGKSYVLTFRGPWSKYWREYENGEFKTLTHGRKIV